MLNTQRLPNFFIIGAAKAGTTTVFNILKQHPDVYLSEVKEPQFFCNDEKYNMGMNYYINTYFSGSEKFKARGEATPHYLFYERVAMRIAKHIPIKNQRFVVILRNPIKRAYSLYWNMVAEGIETLGFEEAIDNENNRLNNKYTAKLCSLRYTYVSSSKYAEQVRAYLKYFNKDQFVFIIFEEFIKDIECSMKSVFDFLGLENIDMIDYDLKSNPFGLPRIKFIHQFIRNPFYLKTKIGKMIHPSIKYRISNNLIQLNRKKHDYPAMSKKVEKKMMALFEKDIKELEVILDKDLSNWLGAVD